jgi:hypothetical protein
MTWFKQLLDVQFSSPIPFNFAKAAALRGFDVEDAGAPWMRLVVEDEARPGLSKLSQRLNSEFIQRRWPATGSDGSAHATTSTTRGLRFACSCVVSIVVAGSGRDMNSPRGKLEYGKKHFLS